MPVFAPKPSTTRDNSSAGSTRGGRLHPSLRVSGNDHSGPQSEPIQLHLRDGVTNARFARTGHDIGRLPLFPSSPLKPQQVSLTVSARDDIYEQQAERIANQVLSAPVRPTVSSAAPHLQRFTERSDRTDDARTDEAPSGDGQPLEPDLSADMESRFGYDFSRVRVHSGAAAARSAQSLNARAYTIGNAVVFGPGRYAPATNAGRRLIAHELAHVVQQSGPSPESENPASFATASAIAGTIHRPPPGMVLRDEDPDAADPWDKLSAPVRARAEELFNDCSGWIHILGIAQQAHQSGVRASWLKTLNKMYTRIGEADSAGKIEGASNAFTDFTAGIGRAVTEYNKEWSAVEKQFGDEHSWLLSFNVKSTDSIEAAKYLDELYQQSKSWLHHGAEFYITDEDYLELKTVLTSRRHIWIGSLRGARIREKQLQVMLNAVAELRRNGDEPEKFVPQWNDRVDQEAEFLASMAKRANDSYQQQSDPLRKEAIRGYMVGFTELRTDLLQRRQQVLDIKPPPQKGVLEKGYAFVKGGVEAFAGIFIEAAKQVVDLAQIGLHFASFGKYEPSFISDMSKAAEQGATTTDLLKNMVTGVIDTPSRFLKACEDGDWEAIGRESVNLYMMAKMIKEAPRTLEKFPEAIKKLPEFLEKTSRSLRILRARNLSFELKTEGHLIPDEPSPTVKGFRPPGDKTPATPPPPPPQSPTVKGFRPPGDTTPATPPPPPPAPPRVKGRAPVDTQPPPPPPSPTVKGFRPPGDKTPTRPEPPPVVGPRIKGFRPPGDRSQPPIPPPPPVHLNSPGPRIKGFRPPGDTTPTTPNTPAPGPSGTVGGFGRKSEPPPPPPPKKQGPMVPVKVPPPKVTSDVGGGDQGRPLVKASGDKPTGGGDKPKTDPPKTGKVEPAEGPKAAQPLLTPEELNEPVLQSKGVTGPKRKLTPVERANANKILRVLERIRAGEKGALNELAGFTTKALRDELAGWIEIYLHPEGGALNQMRLLVRIHQGGAMYVMLRQMH